MKLKHMLAILIAVLIAPFAACARAFAPQGVDALNVQGSHEDTITRVAEGALTPHLLLTFGTAPGSQVKVCTATTRPIGFAYDKAADGATVGVELIGGGRSRLAIASKAIPAGVRVYATAGGKLTDAVVQNAYLVGESLTAAGADGDEFAILPLSPVINP